jgi:hypothetical protein
MSGCRRVGGGADRGVGDAVFDMMRDRAPEKAGSSVLDEPINGQPLFEARRPVPVRPPVMRNTSSPPSVDDLK